MENLKDIEKNCTLIAEFKQPAFVTIDGYSASLFKNPNIARLYYNNKDTYYLYTKITDKEIRIYNNLGDALARLNRFIYNTCSI